jgi:hypothetical protein
MNKENKTLDKEQNGNNFIADVSSRKLSLWNRMVKLMNEHSNEDVRKKADMLLSQYNTAGGRSIKHELEYMLQKYGY